MKNRQVFSDGSEYKIVNYLLQEKHNCIGLGLKKEEFWYINKEKQITNTIFKTTNRTKSDFRVDE